MEEVEIWYAQRKVETCHDSEGAANIESIIVM
jgi:hypothetical protein